MKPPAINPGPRWLPKVAVSVALLGLFFSAAKNPYSSPYDFESFGKIPVLNRGRIKPLDSIARSSLLMLSGHQTVRVGENTLSALEWLLDMLYEPNRADGRAVFEIDNPDVLALMKIQQSNQRRYSMQQIEPYLEEIIKQSNRASEIKPEDRDRFQTAVVNFSNQLVMYRKLQNTVQLSGAVGETVRLRTIDQSIAPLVAHHATEGAKSSALKEAAEVLEPYSFMAGAAEFFPLAQHHSSATTPKQDEIQWVSVGQGVLERIMSGSYHPGIIAFAAAGDAYRAEDPSMFNQAIGDYSAWLQSNLSRTAQLASYEQWFNRIEPFYLAMVVYAAVFLFVMLSWLVWPDSLNRTAYAFLILAFTIHTIGLFSRMLIQGRPPVTNLYSSAIFVGWFAVGLGLVLERIFRRGLGSAVASTIGFSTLIIAHHLAAQGDTLEMMRAVLDSNFWLATHVVCITIGYSSTFLAGFLGILYILRRAFDRSWSTDTAETLERMAFGIVCFATFFSFLGTILGGIWADQSWGRFWGWDPKENGALMIVLWNVFILHARVGQLVDRPTMMTLTVFGNIVTAFSWFGVNMLGIGLHSYGFMEKAFIWLMIFAASQLALIALGRWRQR